MMMAAQQSNNTFLRRTYFSYPGSTNPKVGKLKDITLMELLQTVCEHQKQQIEDVMTKSRAREIVQVRQLFSFFQKKYFEKTSLQAIADVTGHNHATVISSIKHVKALCDSDKKYKTMVGELNSYILLKHKRE